MPAAVYLLLIAIAAGEEERLARAAVAVLELADLTVLEQAVAEGPIALTPPPKPPARSFPTRTPAAGHPGGRDRGGR